MAYLEVNIYEPGWGIAEPSLQVGFPSDVVDVYLCQIKQVAGFIP
jgi:hypothetical protein